MGIVNWIVFILVVIGGLNWGLIGFFDFDIVTSIFGTGTATMIVYDLVGLASLWMLFTWWGKVGK